MASHPLRIPSACRIAPQELLDPPVRHIHSAPLRSHRTTVRLPVSHCDLPRMEASRTLAVCRFRRDRPDLLYSGVGAVERRILQPASFRPWCKSCNACTDTCRPRLPWNTSRWKLTG